LGRHRGDAWGAFRPAAPLCGDGCVAQVIPQVTQAGVGLVGQPSQQGDGLGAGLAADGVGEQCVAGRRAVGECRLDGVCQFDAGDAVHGGLLVGLVVRWGGGGTVCIGWSGTEAGAQGVKFGPQVRWGHLHSLLTLASH
jgi:hypothetical protein